MNRGQDRGTLKQWLGWTIFCGAIPSAALFHLAQHLHRSVIYYWVAIPGLMLYFCILALLKLNVPGTVRLRSPKGLFDASQSFAKRAVLMIYGIFQAMAAYLGFMIVGAFLILEAPHEGALIIYILGPALIWVAGGMWVLTIQALLLRREERRQQDQTA